MVSKLKNYVIMFNGEDITTEDFRIHCLAPLCGVRKSKKVLQQFLYRVAACTESCLARERLEHHDHLGIKYILFDECGVHLRVRCNYYDTFCEIIIVEYGSSTDYPP